MKRSRDARRKTSHVHQIYITDAMEVPDEMPALFRDHRRRLERLYPRAAYRLWSGNALRAMIAAHFPPAVVNAFDTLRPYAFKADLARCCLLEVFGGLYVDLAIRFVDVFAPPASCGMGVFVDLGSRLPDPGAMYNGIIWSEPSRRELQLAIAMIVENCRTRYYGANPLYPTGPVCFARACAAAATGPSRDLAASARWVGESLAIGEGPVHGSRKPSIAYVTPDDGLVALRIKPAGGDLAFAGSRQVNNYNTIWDAREVYGEEWPC